MRIIKKKCIKTNRLILKQIQEEDLGSLIDILKNEEVTKTFMVPILSDEKMISLAKKIIAYSDILDDSHFEYGINLNNKLIGFINDCGITEDEIEIGYVIHPLYHNNGYATEAVSLALAELKEMGFKKVIAAYFSSNIASLRVMEKCGMKKISYENEIEYRGKKHKCLYCGIEF